MLQIRNVAIIAHVDHGKTTLVDALLRQAGTFRDHEVLQDRVMDNMDLEKERGITISAKNASMVFQDVRINLVDTPGHADFGGEVERGLSMVDGAILLVDAAEGCLPQTRFVLDKAFKQGLGIIVIINKVDRPDARINEVETAIHDLFLELARDESQLNFVTLFASGRQGWCSLKREERGTDLLPLFDAIINHLPPPRIGAADAPARVLVSNIAYNPFLGRIAVGRIDRGTIQRNQNVVVLGPDGRQQTARLTALRAFRGLVETDLEQLGPGDIAIMATGIDDLFIGDTIAAIEAPDPLPRLTVDPATVSVEISVNTSANAGREGNYLTSRKLHEWLHRETLVNVAIELNETESSEVFMLKARGELQISIILEKIRREGGECMVGRPRILTRTIDGVVSEPVELVVVDVPESFVGVVTESLSRRRGRLKGIHPFGDGRSRLEFSIPSRGLLGYRSEFLTQTRGEGLMSSLLEGWLPQGTPPPRRANGAIIADRGGVASEYALYNIESRGILFITGGTPVYEGMVVGEHNRDNDLNVNVTREKQLTNFRSAGRDESTKLRPISPQTLEKALDWIDDDEWIEVTPVSIRIRKRILESNRRSVIRNPN